jgi:hypothetical protein
VTTLEQQRVRLLVLAAQLTGSLGAEIEAFAAIKCERHPTADEFTSFCSRTMKFIEIASGIGPIARDLGISLPEFGRLAGICSEYRAGLLRVPTPAELAFPD